MKQKIITALKFLGFLSVGILLLWLVYKDFPMDNLVNGLSRFNYWWIAASCLLSLVSHLARAVRWNILIAPLGHKPRTVNTFFSVLVMYLANYAIPRMGEVSRCGVVKQYEKVPFSKLLGTVIVERTVDVIFLFGLVLVVLLTQFSVVVEFIYNNPDIKDKIYDKRFVFLGALVVGILGIFLLILFKKKIKQNFIYKKFEGIISNFMEGIRAIKKMDHKFEFFLQSIIIWAAYYFMLYANFLSFDKTAHLSLLSALTVLVISSLGMLAPVQGGIGAWHFMVYQSLIIYGVVVNDGKLFAMVAHGTSMLFLVLAGFVALILLPIVNRNYKVVPDKDFELEEAQENSKK